VERGRRTSGNRIDDHTTAASIGDTVLAVPFRSADATVAPIE
jgi:hypothetical protein